MVLCLQAHLIQLLLGHGADYTKLDHLGEYPSLQFPLYKGRIRLLQAPGHRIGQGNQKMGSCPGFLNLSFLSKRLSVQ